MLLQEKREKERIERGTEIIQYPSITPTPPTEGRVMGEEGEEWRRLSSAPLHPSPPSSPIPKWNQYGRRTRHGLNPSLFLVYCLAWRGLVSSFETLPEVESHFRVSSSFFSLFVLPYLSRAIFRAFRLFIPPITVSSYGCKIIAFRFSLYHVIRHDRENSF